VAQGRSTRALDGRKGTRLSGAYYPLFIVLAGAAASALLSERALSLMRSDDKAALMDSAARTRMLTLLVLVLFVALILWRPFVAWVFLGCSFLVLGARMTLRLRRLRLPPAASRLLLTGQLLGVAGIVVCSFIYALRASQ